MQEMQVRSSLDWEGSLEEEMATHSSILAWKVPWAEEPGGGLQSKGFQRAGHDYVCTHQISAKTTFLNFFCTRRIALLILNSAILICTVLFFHISLLPVYVYILVVGILILLYNICGREGMCAFFNVTLSCLLF